MSKNRKAWRGAGEGLVSAANNIGGLLLQDMLAQRREEAIARLRAEYGREEQDRADKRQTEADDRADSRHKEELKSRTALAKLGASKSPYQAQKLSVPVYVNVTDKDGKVIRQPQLDEAGKQVMQEVPVTFNEQTGNWATGVIYKPEDYGKVMNPEDGKPIPTPTTPPPGLVSQATAPHEDTTSLLRRLNQESPDATSRQQQLNREAVQDKFGRAVDATATGTKRLLESAPTPGYDPYPRTR